MQHEIPEHCLIIRTTYEQYAIHWTWNSKVIHCKSQIQATESITNNVFSNKHEH
ncbi:hypothetical protein C0J52_25004 [Blattella germanica]|nr:hypothetical protein C0J52_25004 [Blattella germanica]